MPFFDTGKSMILKRLVLSWIKGSILLRGEVGREGVRWEGRGGEKGRGRWYASMHAPNAWQLR